MITQTNREEFKRIFEDKQTFASTMLIACTSIVGSVEWFDWDPIALKAEIRDACGAHLPAVNADKIQALVLAMTTNQFYESLEAFIGICNALDGDGSDFSTFDPADVKEMAWAVTEVAINDQQHAGADDLFCDEIKAYIGVQAGVEGFRELPKPLTFGVSPKGYQQASEALPGDEAMFAAVYSRGKDDSARVEAVTGAQLRQLVDQISRLPLPNADQESWKKFAGKVLPQTGTRQSPGAAATA